LKKNKVTVMRRVKRAFAGFMLGCLVGSIIGALGGMMDRGSMLILMPSGPPFWGIVGALVGSIVGALYGALFLSSKKDGISLAQNSQRFLREEYL
jgi:hypothetical protein